MTEVVGCYSAGLSARRFAIALKTASWILAIVGVFLVPWYYGATVPVNGESYVLGFNNRIAIFCLAAAIGLAFAGRLLQGDNASALHWLEPRVAFPKLREQTLEYAILAGWTFVWSSLLWSWGTYLADPGWGDARIFHHGMSLIAVGQVPYRDFMWNYGPAMLYLPYWLSWLTGGDLSFERAYLVVVILFNATGYAGVFLIVRAFVLPETFRPVVLLLALLAWAELNLALQYSSLRFVIVPSGLIVMHEAIRFGRIVGYPLVTATLMAAVAMGASLAISPEMGIATAAATISYAGVLTLRGQWRHVLATFAGCGFPVTITLAALPDYFLSVRAFASGQYNFPIYPNLNNITLVLASLIVIPASLASAVLRPSDRRAPLAVALAVGAGMLLPAAFGRADPIHVSFNGVVPTLLMFAAAAAAGFTWIRMWTVSYALVVVLAVQVSYWSVFAGYFRDAITMRRLYDANPGIVAEWKSDWDRLKARHPLGDRLHWETVLPFPKDLNAFTEEGVMIQTAGDEWNLWLGRYLLLQPGALRDYFHPWTQGAVTSPQIASRIQVCSQAKYLLVPEAILGSLAQPLDRVAYATYIDRFFSWMLVYPVRCSLKHEPFQPETEIAKRLLEDFRPVERFQFFMYSPFIICERKSLP